MAIRSDSFEIVRDCRALYLRLLGTLLQNSGLISGPAISAIQDGAGSYFDEVLTSNQRGSFAEEVDGLTSSRLTLLGEDELELSIRLDNLTANLFENTGGGLWKLHLRFVTLLARPNLPKSYNPAGPQSISQGLSAMFAAAGVSTLAQKLALLDRFEVYLRENLPGLYAELNGFLERNGIEPAQPSIVGAPDSSSSQKEAPGKPENALLALQQALLAHQPAPITGSTPSAGDASAQLLNQTSLAQLMFRLEALERMGGLPLSPKPAAAAAAETLMPALFAEDKAPPPPKIIRSAALGLPNTSAESLAIDTLAMIFEAIFEDPTLPDALKAAISSLQIKLLKVAMKDKTLFTDAEHPARLTIDRMGQVMLGLPLDVSARHPVCTSLFGLASQLRAEAGTDKISFDRSLSELDTLIKTREEHLQKAGKTYLPLLAQLEQRDEIANQVRPAINKLLESNPPGIVGRFIEQRWSKILQLVALESGVDSQPWQEHSSTIEGLLWSFQPKIAGEERKSLAQRLPLILKMLKSGMDKIGMSAEDQESFLDDCFMLQTQALRPLQASTATSLDAPPKMAEQLPVSGKISDGTLMLSTLDCPNAKAATHLADYNVGSWLAFRNAGGEAAVGYVCHISPNKQRVLLINPDSGLAVAVHPGILDQQLREGVASIASTRSLFDRAATKALRKSSQS